MMGFRQQLDALRTREPKDKPLIAITMGDPAGIGPEVIVKALADPDIRSLGRFVIYGMEEALDSAAGSAAIEPMWYRLPHEEVSSVRTGIVLADFDEYTLFGAKLKCPTAESGHASIRFVQEASQAAKDGPVDAVVTGPIHKGSWRMAGCKLPGHTEMLASCFRAKRVTMMFACESIRVALASGHVGLFDLRNRFTIGLVFQPIDLLADALRQYWGIEQPRIAVAGLNPHAGESGQFGDEETRIIEPAILMAKEAGIDAQGPFPADTLFRKAMNGRYDGVVAMYHDQALIPVKLIAFDSAVNVTLGLPIIRTSVDHGTAFDIAGENKANPGSMKAAIKLACAMAAVSQFDVPPVGPPPSTVEPIATPSSGE